MTMLRKSIIKKNVSRKISTSKYENVVISVEITEEIEWSTLEERERKTKNINKILINDIASTIDEVLEELNLKRYDAFVERTI